MPYNDTILEEAEYARKLGFSATEDEFHAPYAAILTHWFPTRLGYIIEPRILDKGDKQIVVRYGRSPVLIVRVNLKLVE